MKVELPAEVIDALRPEPERELIEGVYAAPGERGKDERGACRRDPGSGWPDLRDTLVHGARSSLSGSLRGHGFLPFIVAEGLRDV